ncbi:MAG TPA: SDR family oxidoreductase [Bacteroidetes bacterium]|nr:SDR family oxidoreductase [Bacteroidota bacterium]
MIRIVVTGVHGLLGQKLVEVFGPQFCELFGVDLHRENLFQGRPRYHYAPLDITRRADVMEYIGDIRPRVIINTAAMTQVDACEVQREACWRVNVDAVRYLTEAARRVGSRFVQLSSDYVFDGNAGPYGELDRPNPISYYGRSKHASENIALGSGIEAAVVRTVVLFGHGRGLKPSFVSWLVQKLREGAAVKIVTDQISNVTLVDDLAGAIRRIVSLGRTGLYHAAGREILSRYDFALKVAEIYGLDTDPIQPTLTRLLEQTAPRPLQSGLLVDRTEEALKLRFRTVEEALQEYREQEAGFN